MQIIDKAITPDGIEIELRDLSGEHKLPDYNGMVIIFRTIAKKTFPQNKGWYAQKGKEFHSCRSSKPWAERRCSRLFLCCRNNQHSLSWSCRSLCTVQNLAEYALHLTLGIDIPRLIFSRLCFFNAYTPVFGIYIIYKFIILFVEYLFNFGIF